MKLCINSRDELTLIELSEVACFRADGNFTIINYMGGQQSTVSLGLSKMEKLVSTAYPKGKASPFVRLGRSLLVNQSYLCQIDVQKQKLVLSDFRKFKVTIAVTKTLLKALKNVISEHYKMPK